MHARGVGLTRPLAVGLALAFVGVTGAATTTVSRSAPRPQAQSAQPLSPQATNEFAAAWAQQPRVDVGIPAAGAKVVVVKFNDYQCPPCAATHAWYKPVLERIEKTNPGAVKVVFKDWPWNPKCNFNLAPGVPPEHPAACEGAAAVRMARERGKAKEVEMQEWLYANQPTQAPATVRAAAERILGIQTFDAEYARKLPDIRKDATDGAALHIDSTPTFFINGVRIGAIPAAYFELAIQLELKKAAGR